MTEIFAGKYTASWDKPLVVFLIGMRVNYLWKVHKWFPVARAMKPMLDELYETPESGFLWHELTWKSPRAPILIQYWKSFEDLERYARAPDNKHMPAWAEFYKKVGMNGDVGIWHETYLVEPGAWEAIYGNMPKTGLAAATGQVAVTPELLRARDRVRRKLDTAA